MFALSKLEWLLVALALLLFPGSPWGAEPQAGAGASAPAASLFDRLDRDKNGYLSREELASDEARSRNWIAVDRDRDGRISRTEFNLVAAPPSPTQPSAAAGGSQPPKQE
jgi:Ca2+-binding EF-hand superfamily protein